MHNHLFVSYVPATWFIVAVAVVSGVIIAVIASRRIAKDLEHLDRKDALIGALMFGVGGGVILGALTWTVISLSTHSNTTPTWYTQVESAHIVSVKDAEVVKQVSGGMTMDVVESGPVGTMACPLTSETTDLVDCERLDDVPLKDLDYGADHGPVSSVGEAIKKVWG